MANFCLPKFATDAFKAKLVDGSIDPQKLADMSSEERHAVLADIVGESNAKGVNALFESKTLLKNQQAGMINWAKKIAGLKPDVLRDVVSKIERLDKVLNPADEKSFLADLAAQKLGTGVTHDEAIQITDLSKQVQQSKAELIDDPFNKTKQLDYGNKYLNLTDYVESLKPKSSLWTVSNVLSIPKSALTSVLHFSASFVQLWGMVSMPEFWKAQGEQFKYFADPVAYKDLQAAIIGHPDYPLAMDGKLGLTKLGDKLNMREEAIQSSILDNTPGLGKLTKAASRSFTGIINNVRFARFTNLLDAARLNGEDVSKGSKVVRDIANTVNDFTGRGALGTGDKYSQSSPALNATFFSPRKLSATMNMFNPERYLNPDISPTARIGALRQLSGSILATAAFLELAHMSGASVNLNPISTNFLKAKFGNTTFDMTGGNATYLRLIARVVTNKSISGSGKLTELGKTYGSPTSFDEGISFLRGKLSPVASVVADLIARKDIVGQPVTVQSEAYDKLTPIIIQDYISMAQNDPKNVAAWLPALSAIFGVGMETATQKK